MNVISNNLANVNTVGFKKDRAVFEDLLYQNIRQAGGSTGGDNISPTGLMIGTGVRIVSTEKNYNQGSMIQTKNALDFAIQGEGMFQVLPARWDHGLHPRRIIQVVCQSGAGHRQRDAHPAIDRDPGERRVDQRR